MFSLLCRRAFTVTNCSRINSYKYLHSSCIHYNLDETFKSAQKKLNQFTNDPGNEAKLKIYALFKQSTDGPCNKPKPGMMDFVGRAKWDAWTGLGSISKEEAMKEYVDLIDSIAKEQGGTSEQSSTTESSSDDLEGMTVTKKDGVLTLTLNRPEKKNALTWEMYGKWTDILNDSANSDDVKVVVITGTGDYFCSGNDLSNFTGAESMKNPKAMAAKGRDVLQKFVASFIDFPKPLIAVINGPAVGISVTTLGLYDQVFAIEHATFHTPFSNLGQTPEGCSSYTFPKMCGYARASNYLMFNKKWDAKEALDMNLVSEIIPRENFDAIVQERIKEYASLPPQTLKLSKNLLRMEDKQKLHETNEKEVNQLQERWTSDECINAIMSFFQKKSKAKL